MKVSIIIPVWNVEDYLVKCLDSLVRQTLKEKEIIVVNDGSPDNSQAIIDSYVAKYPELIRGLVKENGGQGSARNLGLQYATGEYIGFVDSDDWLSDDYYEKLYNKMVDEGSDIAICDMQDVYPTHTVHHDCVHYDFKFQKTLSACNKMFRREYIGNLRFVENIWYEDFNFTAKLMARTDKISVVDDVYYYCHCREVSTMTNHNSLKNLDIITAVNGIEQYLKEQQVEQTAEIIETLVFKDILFGAVMRVSVHESKERNQVIKQLVAYSRSKLHNYKKMGFYDYIPKNTKLVAALNLHGMWRVSKFLVTMKQKVKA